MQDSEKLPTVTKLGLVLALSVLTVIWIDLALEFAEKATEAKVQTAANAVEAKAQAKATDKARRAAAPLALLSARGYEEHGYVNVEGQVQNRSSDAIENVEAVATWYSTSGDFIRSDIALVEFNPIMPGQTSPFRVMSRANPQMATFTIEFRLMMGGKLEIDDRR